jgi:hypothetical protein
VQALDLGSPYEDPICLKDIQAPSAHVRTAKLAFEDPFMVRTPTFHCLLVLFHFRCYSRLCANHL